MHSEGKSEPLLSEKEQTISVPAKSSFVKLNNQQTGFYRVKYSEALLKKIHHSFDKLSRNDKIGIVADGFTLAAAGVQSTLVPLNLLSGFKLEDGYLVWNEISLRVLEVLDLFWEKPEIQTPLKKKLQSIYEPLYTSLGFDFNSTDGDLVSLLRASAISMAGKLGHPKVIQEAKKRYALFIAGDQSALHPNVREAVFKIVIQNGGEKEFDQILNLYNEYQVADQKLAALRALGSAPTDALIDRALELSLSKQVRSQDIIYLIAPIADNSKGRLKSFEFMKKNWAILYDRYYKGSVAILSRVVSSCTQGLLSLERAKQVEEFFKEKEVSGINRAIQQSLEKIKISVKWMERDEAAVSNWVK